MISPASISNPFEQEESYSLPTPNFQSFTQFPIQRLTYVCNEKISEVRNFRNFDPTLEIDDLPEKKQKINDPIHLLDFTCTLESILPRNQNYFFASPLPSNTTPHSNLTETKLPSTTIPDVLSPTAHLSSSNSSTPSHSSSFPNSSSDSFSFVDPNQKRRRRHSTGSLYLTGSPSEPDYFQTLFGISIMIHSMIQSTTELSSSSTPSPSQSDPISDPYSIPPISLVSSHSSLTSLSCSLSHSTSSSSVPSPSFSHSQPPATTTKTTTTTTATTQTSPIVSSSLGGSFPSTFSSQPPSLHFSQQPHHPSQQHQQQHLLHHSSSHHEQHQLEPFVSFSQSQNTNHNHSFMMNVQSELSSSQPLRSTELFASHSSHPHLHPHPHPHSSTSHQLKRQSQPHIKMKIEVDQQKDIDPPSSTPLSQAWDRPYRLFFSLGVENTQALDSLVAEFSPSNCLPPHSLSNKNNSNLNPPSEFIRRPSIPSISTSSSTTPTLLTASEIFQFLEAVLEVSGLGSTGAVCACVLLLRLLVMARIELTPGNWRTLWLLSVVLVEKLHRDRPVRVRERYLSVLSGLSCREFLGLELRMLRDLDFFTSISRQDYLKVYLELRGFVLDYVDRGLLAPPWTIRTLRSTPFLFLQFRSPY